MGFSLKQLVLMLALQSIVVAPERSTILPIEIPKGTTQKLHYVLDLDGPGIIDFNNIGIVDWTFSSNGKSVSSDFKVRTNNQLIASALGAYTSEVRSINTITSSGTLTLDNYLYRENDRSGYLKYEFKSRKEGDSYRVHCVKRDEISGGMGTTPCRGIFSFGSPDLFALLATVAYVKDLPLKVKEGISQHAFYVGQDGSVRLELSKPGDGCTFYLIDRVGSLLNKDISLEVCLSNTYPYLMKSARVTGQYGSIKGTVVIRNK